MSFLLDTNVVSELRKKHPNRGVRRWFDDVDSADLYLSVLVIGELRQGVERLRGRDHPTTAEVEHWLDEIVERFADRVLPVTADVAQRWGLLNATKAGPVIDCLLAATALVHDLTLVSRNERHLRPTGARVLNPFTG